MYSDHYRGDWNAKLPSSQQNTGPATRGADPTNPFDTPLADATAVMSERSFDPGFKDHLAATMMGNGAAPAAFPSGDTLKKPSRPAPSRPPPPRVAARLPPPALEATYGCSPQKEFTSPSPFDVINNSFTSSPYIPLQPDQSFASSLPTPEEMSWDPFFGEDNLDDSQMSERVPLIDFDAEDDDDSDLGDEESQGEIVAFDETSLANIIPQLFETETMLREFLLSPLESESLVKCIIMFDPTEKVWTFTNQSNGMRLMTGFMRRDGLKRLTTQMLWAINFCPRAVEKQGSLKATRSRYGSWSSQKSSKSTSKTADFYLAKMKSNVNGSAFAVFDTGLNPSKAVGAMHARRELGAIRFEKLSHDSYRRKSRACLPALGHNRRPLTKKEQMFERLARGDDTVVSLANHTPGRPMHLPRLADFNGMAMSSSVKNIIFHNPKDSSGDAVYVCGKTSKRAFNCYFKSPVSPVMAFAFALASISSYVNPAT